MSMQVADARFAKGQRVWVDKRGHNYGADYTVVRVDGCLVTVLRKGEEFELSHIYIVAVACDEMAWEQ